MTKKSPECQNCHGIGYTVPEWGDINDADVCQLCSGTGFQDKEGNDGIRLGREE